MANYFEDMVVHIARLYQTPGWGAFARQWAKDLESDKSEAFKGITEAVRSRLKSSAEAPKSGVSKA